MGIFELRKSEAENTWAEDFGLNPSGLGLKHDPFSSAQLFNGLPDHLFHL